MEEVIIKGITFTNNYNQIQHFYMQYDMISPLLILQPSPQHETAVQDITIQQFMTWYDKHDSKISEDFQVEHRLPKYKS